MGVIQRIVVCFVLFCIIITMPACRNSFHTASISLIGIALSNVYAHSGAAYYLAKDGTLYCTGADSDGASFVAYQNQAKGIVAKNVKSFNEYGGGGCYIDSNNDLYMWNETILPLYGYNKKTEHIKILDNIRFVDSGSHCLIYIDMNSDLYLIGTLNGEMYSVNAPKLLARNVVCADVKDGTVLWAFSDGGIGSFGKTDPIMMEVLNAQFANSNITDIHLERDYATVLSNRQLWYYGDYNKLVSGEDSQSLGLTMLNENIVDVSCSIKTIMALESGGKALLWGRCVSNNSQNTDIPQFEFFEQISLTQDAKNIFVSDSCICYVDGDGKSNIFYATGWPAFYGNSTKDACVGIKREPIQWIK